MKKLTLGIIMYSISFMAYSQETQYKYKIN